MNLNVWPGWVTSTSPLLVARTPGGTGVPVVEHPAGATYDEGDKVRVLAAGSALIILYTIKEA